MKKILLFIGLFLLLCCPVFAAGTLVVSIENPQYLNGYNNLPCTIVVDCTSDADGNLSGAICSTYEATALTQGGSTTYAGVTTPSKPISKIMGKIKSIETAPGASGDLSTDLPTDAYDLTITDPYSFDVACGYLVNRSGTVAQNIIPISDIFVNSELTVNGSNMGNAKKIRIIIKLGSN